MASYPFRLGPPAPAGEHQAVTSTPFGGLAVVHNLSGVGDALVTVALAGSLFVSVSLHAARTRTALGLVCTVLPFVVVGPFIGPLIDRVRGGRRFIVFLAAAGRVGACLMMAAWIDELLLFPAAFFSLVCSKTHAVVKASLVPTVVDSHQDLVRANSRLAVGSSLLTAGAAGIAALVFKAFGSGAVLHLDVLVFGATAVLALVLLRPAAPPATASAETEAGGRRVGRGGAPPPREVARARIAMTGMRAMAGFMTALVIFAFRRQGAPVIWYGLVAVASVGGNLAGAALAPVLRDRLKEKFILAGAGLVIVAAALAVTQWPDLHRRPAALLLAATVGFGASVAKTAFDAIVQHQVPDEDRSRLFARYETVLQLGWVAGALVPTLIATSLLVGFGIVAATVLITSVVFLVSFSRRREPAAGVPAPAAAPN
jgi:MFS family permease